MFWLSLVLPFLLLTFLSILEIGCLLCAFILEYVTCFWCYIGPHLRVYLSLRTDIEFGPLHIVGNAKIAWTLADRPNVFLHYEMVKAFWELRMGCFDWVWSVSYKLILNAWFSSSGTTFGVVETLGDGDQHEEMDHWVWMLGYMCLAPSFTLSASCDICLNHSDFCPRTWGQTAQNWPL